ncbi:CheR family methyltransferase [Spirochaeta cellobiosiphila]|uniref:CheR family methyltransferase n=1 Tax=Spirochaeta cellobiosiphila TaxID=504483 RepID=UPI00041FB5B4|nr:protein-glutamate O-methyltransferase CheR [Spirochaeta cellobiosiphila]
MSDINNGIIDITDDEFKKISQLVYSQFGINLTDKKKALVRGRLNKVIKEKGFDSFSVYYKHILEDNTGKELTQLVDKISTNHTYFFRENDHFDFFTKNEMPTINNYLKDNHINEYRLWCAGCASGEEAYTIAMLIDDYCNKNKVSWRPRILATDISITALEKAANGLYPTERMEGIPIEFKNKYFKKVENENWQVSDKLRNMILFKKLNFMRSDFPFKNKFHTIFCRNVMIYFDKPTKEDLIRKFGQYLRPGGRFFIGHSETLGRDNNEFSYVRPALYQKNEV